MFMENKPCCWQYPGPITLDSDQPSPRQSCDPNCAWDRVTYVPESSCLYSWHRQCFGTISKFTKIKIKLRLVMYVCVYIEVLRRSSKRRWPHCATAAGLSCAVWPQFLKRRHVPALTGTSCVPSQAPMAAAALGVHQGPSLCCQGHSSQFLMGSSCCQHCQAPPNRNS